MRSNYLMFVMVNLKYQHEYNIIMASNDEGLVQIHISIWGGDYPVKEIPSTREIQENRIMLYQNFIWGEMQEKLKNKEYYQLLSEIVYGKRNQHLSYGPDPKPRTREEKLNKLKTMDIKSLSYGALDTTTRDNMQEINNDWAWIDFYPPDFDFNTEFKDDNDAHAVFTALFNALQEQESLTFNNFCNDPTRWLETYSRTFNYTFAGQSFLESDFKNYVKSLPIISKFTFDFKLSSKTIYEITIDAAQSTARLVLGDGWKELEGFGAYLMSNQAVQDFKRIIQKNPVFALNWIQSDVEELLNFK